MTEAVTVPRPGLIHVEVEIQPREGRLIPLKTKAELGAEDVTVDVYVVEIPLKSANSILNLLQNAIPNKDAIDLQHLRRFAKPGFLPKHLQHHASMEPDLETIVLNEQTNKLSLTLHLLICAVSLIPLPVVIDLFNTFPPFEDAGFVPRITTIPVPLYPATSEDQAKRWSSQYWPTVYKRSNPFGPHPSLVARSQDELQEQAGMWMALAQLAAEQVSIKGMGKTVGVVIVDRGSAKGPSAVAVAGDARWCGTSNTVQPIQGSENVMAHAVMRAIGMIAKKRLRVADSAVPNKGAEAFAVLTEDVFLDQPITPVEHVYYNDDNLAPGGYLCLDLDIYITHEPCVMCSMAILHSRFGRVVFGQRMPLTGGLTAEQDAMVDIPASAHESYASSELETGRAAGPSVAISSSAGLGYGIFWRPELNWKLLAWQWKDAIPHWSNGLDGNVHI
ncbi:MAG: hypothetical protein M1812_005298 [Candelaria pacifica]|nr:MAG: hypothetical protein M1812_005298 [Candelaria pacifica]